MSFIELDVVSPLVEYHLVLKRRITLLIGDSGSGKTVLDNLVRDPMPTKSVWVTPSPLRVTSRTMYIAPVTPRWSLLPAVSW